MNSPAVTGGVTLRAASGGNRVAVVLHHADDAAVAMALDVWAELSGASQISPFMCVEHRHTAADDGSAPPEGGPATRLLISGAWRPVDLMDTLHSLGELNRVDIMTACTARLDSAQQAELAQADIDLRQGLRRIMPEATPVSSHRVWIPRYGDAALAPEAAFASSDAASVLVVLPEDRQFERAAAMPVGGPGHDGAYAWHVAVEVASLGGLWSTMEGAPLEYVETASSGLGRPLVRLVRSMVRAARIHTPLPEQSLDGTGLLPLTPGMRPAPDSAYTVRAAAPHVFPPTFRQLTDAAADTGAKAPDGALPHSELRGLIPLSEAAHARRLAAETVSSVLRRDDDAAEAASRLDDYIAETVEVAPWTEPLARAAGPSATAEDGGASDDVAEARRLLERTRVPVSIEAVPVRGWDELLDGVFGVADATKASERIRAAATGARYVVIDPHALAPDAQDLPAAISALDSPEHLHVDGRYRTIGSAGGLVGIDPSDARSDAQPDDEAPSAADLGESADEAAPDIEPRDDPNPSAEATLLSEVTGQFDSEVQRSERDLEHRLELLQAQMHRDNRPEPGVTTFVAYALLASVLIGMGSLLTLTPLREVFTPDRLLEEWRVALFLLLSLFATLPPVLRLTPSRSWSAQIRLTLVAAVYGPAAAAAAVAAPAIEDSFLDRPGRWFPAGAVVLIVMALAIVAWVRGFGGDRALLGPLAVLVGDRTAGAVPFAYGFVIAVSGLNFDATAPAIFENRSWRLLTVLLAMAVAVALATGGMVYLVRRRDRRQVREWKQRIDELVDDCELGLARTEVLEVLKAHWLTTAAAVARLMHRPFGTHFAAAPPQDPEPGVRKLLVFDLDLTEGARDAYLGGLLPELASRGWLREQYRRMSAQFVRSERSRLGIGPDDVMPPPEHCTYPMPLRSVRRAEASGPRWQFAERVYDGDFDALLHEAAEDAVGRAMEATLTSEQTEVSLRRAEAGRHTLPQLFAELLPAGEARLPSGTLPASTASSPEYRPRVWWPEIVSMRQDSALTEHKCRLRRADGTALFHAVRVDVSEPVDIDRLTPLGGSEASAPVGVADQHGPDSTDPPAEPLM